jgi:hypothetical protein
MVPRIFVLEMYLMHNSNKFNLMKKASVERYLMHN